MSRLPFSDLNLSPEMMRAIADQGFTTATKIQAGVIPLLLAGKHIVGQSETGSGKTAAFMIPIIERINQKLRTPQALILCPTRELAMQVASECSRLMRHKTGITVLAVYGGQPIVRQLEVLRRGVQIVVGTPGRILDHLSRKTLSLQNVSMVVLDEADEMLDMGFTDDINTILDKLPHKRQMAFFSATIPPEIRAMISRYMVDPHHISISGKALTVATTEQRYLSVDYRQKTDILRRLLDLYEVKRGLVFCNMKKTVDELVAQLKSRGYKAEALHGDLMQAQRDRVMSSFRRGGIQLLVATDVAGRGIDVNDIDYVFNYDLPMDEEDYVHRIGRTSRAGKSGTAISMVCGREIYKLQSIERYAGTRIALQKTPSYEEAQGYIVARLLTTIRASIASDDLTAYITMVKTMCRENHSPVDIAAALLKLYAPIPKPNIERKDPERVTPRPDRREREKTRRGAGRHQNHYSNDFRNKRKKFKRKQLHP
jgi:ATP-dependent RNA helicase DeaD